MTTLSITVPGNKPGELVYFTLNVLKSNFFKVIEMNFGSIENVLKGEKEGHYTISK